MKKPILIFLCALSGIINSKAQTILFDSLYDYKQELQFGFDVFQLGDTGYITLTTSLNNNNNNGEAIISFYDSLGDRKINKVYGDSGYQYYIGEWGSMQKTYDSGYAFGGSILKNSDYSSLALLMKLNAHGDTEFVKTFGDTTKDWQNFYRSIQTRDSGYALIGTQVKNWRDSAIYGIYIYVTRTDKHGKLLWQKSYAGTRTDGDGWSILELPNHHLVLSGATEISGFYYPLIIETDSIGNTLKQRMLNGVNFSIGGRMTPTYVGIAEWNYIDTVINVGDYHIGSVITLLDSNYNITNRIIYNHTTQNCIYEVRQLKDSSFVLVGLIEYTDSAYDVGWIAKMNKKGEKEWEHLYTHSHLYNEFADFEQTGDNGFIVTGRAFDPSIPNYTQDLWLVKLDSNGCLQPGCLLNTGTVEVEPENGNLEIYPNPNNGDFTVDLPNTGLSKPEIFTVYNLTGQQVFSTKLSNQENEIYLASQLAGGVYICRIEAGDNNVVERKLVVIK